MVDLSKLRIATAKSAQTPVWKNTTMSWSCILERLSSTKRTPETLKEYFAMPKDRQDEIKDVGGFVGGFLRGGVLKNKRTGKETKIEYPEGLRRKSTIGDRQIVALDIDFGDLRIWDSFVLLDYTGAVYSTHKHTTKKPRLRLVFPLSRPVNPEEYQAVARVVASWFDIDSFDDTTFQPERLMYWPSTSIDGEYVFYSNEGKVIDPDEVLDELDDPTDPVSWPRSSREQDKVRNFTRDKAQDPLSKDGVVGAFCRAYGIADAIDTFLSDVYIPTADPDRYSYAGGSTSGGLLVYDDLHAFSHHATDPAGDGRAYNAFDLVRVHLYGSLDEDKPRDTPVTKLPSYKAMSTLALNDGGVKKEVVAARQANVTADAYNDEDQADEQTPVERPERRSGRVGRRERTDDPDKWIESLEVEKDGITVKGTICNVGKIMRNDPNLKGRMAYNVFECREVGLKRLPWEVGESTYPRPLKDVDDSSLREYLEGAYGINHKGNVTDAVANVLWENRFNPVTDYLDGLEWDGTERLDTLLIDLFGADDTPYTRAVTRKAFTACVARAYKPGSKYDYLLTIIGKQGIGKSTLLKRMGKSWFMESLDSLKGKDAKEGVQGAWIIELSELEALKRADTAAVKAFISTSEDRFRVAYGRRLEYFPRRCAFFGTGNERDFLRDVTGNRRFWVVDTIGRTPSGKLTIKDLDDDMVDALWSEAKYRFEQGELLYLTDALEEAALQIQDDHLETDDRAGMIAEFLDKRLPGDWSCRNLEERRQFWEMSDQTLKGTKLRQTVSVVEIFAECLGQDPKRISRKDSYEISRIMKSLREWVPSDEIPRDSIYGRQRIYKRKVEV